MLFSKDEEKVNKSINQKKRTIKRIFSSGGVNGSKLSVTVVEVASTEKRGNEIQRQHSPEKSTKQISSSFKIVRNERLKKVVQLVPTPFQ